MKKYFITLSFVGFLLAIILFYPDNGAEVNATPIAPVDDICEANTHLVNFNFDEGCGTLIRDSSGFGNHGRALNTNWTTDSRSGFALEFNTFGNDSYVDLRGYNLLTTPTQVSVEMWIKRSQISQNNFPENETLVDKYPEFLILIQTDNTVEALVRDSRLRPNNWINLTSNTVLNANTWYKIKFVRGENVFQLYINDMLESTTPNSFPIPTNFSVTPDVKVGGFNGIIDDFKMTGY